PPPAAAPANVVVRAGELPPALDTLRHDAAQRARLVAVVTRRRHESDSVLRAVVPALRAVLARMHEEVRAELTPAQRAAFDAATPLPLPTPGRETPLRVPLGSAPPR
ncbi:hypothetical protein, partial [Roseisolibacter sp. H3M3-2]|uniref:hypothetical protein n=1 Tax=Roseisolibacter sp. H3M3-2 TaxID=3031323 RepID=UPI0023DA8BEB